MESGWCKTVVLSRVSGGTPRWAVETVHGAFALRPHTAGMVAVAIEGHTQTPPQQFHPNPVDQWVLDDPTGFSFAEGHPFCAYCLITPQAIRFPEAPLGSVFSSSAFSCTTIEVPSFENRELEAPGSRETVDRMKVASPV